LGSYSETTAQLYKKSRLLKVYWSVKIQLQGQAIVRGKILSKLDPNKAGRPIWLVGLSNLSA